MLAFSAECVPCVYPSLCACPCAGAHPCGHPCVCLLGPSTACNAIAELGPSQMQAFHEEGRCGTSLLSAEELLGPRAPDRTSPAGPPPPPPCSLEDGLLLEEGLVTCLPLLLLRLPLLPTQAEAVLVPVGRDASLALAAAF